MYSSWLVMYIWNCMCVMYSIKEYKYIGENVCELRIFVNAFAAIDIHSIPIVYWRQYIASRLIAAIIIVKHELTDRRTAHTVAKPHKNLKSVIIYQHIAIACDSRKSLATYNQQNGTSTHPHNTNMLLTTIKKNRLFWPKLRASLMELWIEKKIIIIPLALICHTRN